MKTKLLSLAALLASAAASFAAPLTGTTAVYTKPETTSPAVTFLKAGSEPPVAADGMAPLGWLAVELPGPFEAYVLNKDLSKGLDVKPGSNIYLAPKLDAGVLTIAAKDEKITLTGLHGKFTQISLERRLIGYIKVDTAAPAPLPPVAATPAPAPAGGTPVAPAPVAPGMYGSPTGGQAVALGDGGAAALPRQFAGKFVSTRSAFRPRRPYDWALVDDAGKRYAYLEISKLLLTEQLENYVDHYVVVFGAATAVPDTKDFVIKVETLQLK